jgi:hypothetical protein
MTLSLDIEDLSSGDILPKLLLVRQSSHPGLFRSIDGGSIFWRVGIGVLRQLKVNGRLAFGREMAMEAPDRVGI